MWSAVFGVPMVVSGVYLHSYASQYPLVESQPETPPAAGIVIAAFGLFVIGMGVYVHLVAAPEAPRMRDGERVIEDRNPAQRSVLAKAVSAVPILALGGYLLYFTERPLYQPTVAFAGGLFVFSRGLYQYWQNTLTTYFLTNRRVIEEYRFISLVRNEVPLEKVRGVEETRSAWESLFGLGSLAVRSGSSGGLTVSVDQIYEPAEFADLVRAQLTEGDDGVTTPRNPPEREQPDGESGSQATDSADSDSVPDDSAGEAVTDTRNDMTAEPQDDD